MSRCEIMRAGQVSTRTANRQIKNIKISNHCARHTRSLVKPTGPFGELVLAIGGCNRAQGMAAKIFLWRRLKKFGKQYLTKKSWALSVAGNVLVNKPTATASTGAHVSCVLLPAIQHVLHQVCVSEGCSQTNFGKKKKKKT